MALSVESMFMNPRFLISYIKPIIGWFYVLNMIVNFRFQVKYTCGLKLAKYFLNTFFEFILVDKLDNENAFSIIGFKWAGLFEVPCKAARTQQ